MNRFYAIESTTTTTGLKADHRLAVKASDIEQVAHEAAGHGFWPGIAGI